jgi:hypothetical protein
MTLMPPGWSVDVDGTWVVVRGPWASHSELYMTASGARALANELGIAYLAAAGAFGLLGDRDAVRSALKDALRRRPGYLEPLERDLQHVNHPVRFSYWDDLVSSEEIVQGDVGQDIRDSEPATADPARPDGPEDSRRAGESSGQQAAGRGTDHDLLSRFFAGPTDEDRARLRSDLLSRAALVRTNGWEPYRGVWSTGELIGVAALLETDSELAALGETLQSAWSRWAFDLWGLKGGQADVDNGCEATRQWFEGAANEVNQ